MKQNGKEVYKPVLVAINLVPTKKNSSVILDFAVVKSAYTKEAIQQYLNENSILYVDPDKKRTDSWLSRTGLSLPVGENRYGPIRRISYADGKVKVQNPKSMTEMQKKLFEAGVIDEFGNKMFSARNDGGMSNRQLLANALESSVQHEVEAKRLAEYKENIRKVSELQMQLGELNNQIKELSFAKGARDKEKLRELRDEKIKTENRINVIDGALLRLESMQAIKNVLERERERARQASEKKGRAALDEYRKSSEKKQREIIDQYKKARADSVESRNRTQYREKIHKMADKFHRMATAPSKRDTAHAPIAMMNALCQFCSVFAESEQNALKKSEYSLTAREMQLEFDNEMLGVTKGRQKEAEIINRIRERNDKKNAAISEMLKRYDEIRKDPAFAMFYDEHVNNLLDDLSKQLGGTNIYDMNTEQLKQVYNTMQAMMHTITNANRVFSMEKDKTLIGVTRKLGSEIDSSNVSHGAIATAVRRYGMWQMSPDTFFNFICGYAKDNEGKAVQKMFENGTKRMLGVQRDFYQMFRHLTEAEDKNTARHIRQMMQNPMKEMIDWGLKDASGNSVKTTRDMMIQAYMLLNQKDSFDSLVYGGFKLPNAKEYYDGRIDNAYGDADEDSLLSEAIGESYMDLLYEIKKRQADIDSGGLDVSTVNKLQEEISELRDRSIALVEGAEARLISLRDSIAKQLTDADLDAIETAKKWYKYTGQLMTDVYVQMYGYKPNLVDGYVPIHRDLTTVLPPALHTHVLTELMLSLLVIV